MSEVKKQWKEREDLSISELEDIWFANRNLEMARSIILAVKDFQKITLEEKLEFLRSVFYEESNLRSGEGREKLCKYIHSPLLDAFLFLLPEWKQELVDKEYSRLILALLTFNNIYPYISVSAGQIKKFARSYLNSVKKEDMQESLIVDVLIKNRMFEELVNYDFTTNSAIKELGFIIFPGNENPFLYAAVSGYKKKFTQALKENREPHAISALLRILAKRGDLEKIFDAEQAQK